MRKPQRICRVFSRRFMSPSTPIAASTIFRPGLLAGRTALVTGGGTGIGLAIAHELGALGARVTIAARDRDRLAEAAAGLRAAQIEVRAETVNIRKETEIEALLDRLQAEGWLPDILVNNAGGQFQADPLAISANGFRAVVDLNLNGTWHMTKAVGGRLLAAGRPGRIVNIVLSLFQGLPGAAHAGAARAGVINLTKSLALAWGRHGITINAVAPGTIDTPALAQYDQAEMAADIQRLPIKRMGRPEEVAQLVAFLVSPAGDYMTGTTLILDGGDHLIGPVPAA
jgi:NAD(P)-dependent dehydrogenase (short-subunit alcohol dehydrogenase family)